MPRFSRVNVLYMDPSDDSIGRRPVHVNHDAVKYITDLPDSPFGINSCVLGVDLGISPAAVRFTTDEDDGPRRSSQNGTLVEGTADEMLELFSS